MRVGARSGGIAGMLRSGSVRTLGTGRISFLAPVYGAAVPLVALACGGSPEALEIGAPPPLPTSRAASLSEFRWIPNVETKRPSHPGVLSACELVLPSGVSPNANNARTALINISNKPSKTRGIKNADRVEQFLFISYQVRLKCSGFRLMRFLRFPNWSESYRQ
jgi:hypothetical protein